MRHDILQNDTEHNDTEHYDTEHNDTERNDIERNDIERNDIEHNDTQYNDSQQSRVGAYTKVKQLSGAPLLSRLLALPANNRLNWKGLPGTNTSLSVAPL
jgi:hypothetical protein